MDHHQQSSQSKQQLQESFHPAATFNELLISEVQAHPQLYDQQHRVCTDNGERNAIWEVIASRIDDTVNGEFAKKRWLQMRDRYRKELKMALRTSIQPKWPYFPKLAWLDPYLKDAKNIKSGTPTPLSQQSSMSLTDFISNQQSGAGGGSGTYDSKEFLTEHLRFPQLTPTVNLLETLMAASTALLNNTQQHKGRKSAEPLISSSSAAGGGGGLSGDFSSPDSAVASTSDGDTDLQLNQQRNLMLRASNLAGLHSHDQQQHTGGTNTAEGEEGEELEGMDCEGRGTTNEGREEEGEEDNETGDGMNIASPLKLPTASSSSSSTSSTMLPPMDFAALFANSPLRLLNSSTDKSVANGTNRRSPSTTSGGARARNSGGTARGTNNTHQPPYLVRRGGSGTQSNNSKNRARLGSMSASEAISPRKFDILSMCSSPIDCPPISSTTTAPPPSDSWARLEWDNDDEDLLFARLVVARLKKFSPRERRTIRSRIFQWLDQKEEDGEEAMDSVADK